MLKSLSLWQKLSLCSQLSLVIALVGLLALLLNTGLVCLLLGGTLLDQQGTQLAAQAQALSRSASPQTMLQAMPVLCADAPQRHVIIIDTAGRLSFASPMPASTLQTLERRARHDLITTPTVTSRSPHWDQQGDQIIADVFLQSGKGQTAGVLLLAVDQQIVALQWSRALALVLLSAGMAIALMLLGSFFAAQILVRPLRLLTAVAQQIATGDYTRRMTPVGPSEMQALALTFNWMIEEVLQQRCVEQDLLLNIAHELAAPLGLIRGYAEALSDGVIGEETQRVGALQAISIEATRLARLCGNLLDLARLETGQCSPEVETVPAAELLTGLVQRFTPLARQADISLLLDLAPDVPILQTDGWRLEQVLVNLLENAWRYTPVGGTITLRAARDKAGVRLEVEDTGRGIPPEHLARIWERFYRVEEGRDRQDSSAGVGLGLAICQCTVAWLGGHIDAKSTPGQGTTFTIWLPHKPPDVSGCAIGPCARTLPHTSLSSSTRGATH